MKIFFLVIAMSCCFLVGFLIKNSCKHKQLFFKDLTIFCEFIINNISASNEKINILLKQNFNEYDKDFNQFLYLYNDYINSTINKDEFFRKTKIKLYFLQQKEINELLCFFDNLGKLTKEEEIANISNKRVYWQKILKNIEEKKIMLSNLYFKLFIILGLFLFIVFI